MKTLRGGAGLAGDVPGWAMCRAGLAGDVSCGPGWRCAGARGALFVGEFVEDRGVRDADGAAGCEGAGCAELGESTGERFRTHAEHRSHRIPLSLECASFARWGLFL